ncbi:hypothetical protein RV15_GL002478 [Enterococcus silesiacus]|uniref:Uncharacterized protein n=1 Tax=Enterococcus silesiacus TaxID=332949 RepID=A0AA91JMP4_9ENTE|nr:hypothetical protein RV15_GL002478 [Enterococcus silesiacus]
MFMLQQLVKKRENLFTFFLSPSLYFLSKTTAMTSVFQ